MRLGAHNYYEDAPFGCRLEINNSVLDRDLGGRALGVVSQE